MVDGRRWKVEGVSTLHDATKFDFPASQRGFCFQEKRKSIPSTSYFAHDLHNNYSMYIIVEEKKQRICEYN